MVGLTAAGCGSAAREAAPKDCVVRVYFCTADTCARPASRTQINKIETRLREADGVYSVDFVSKEAALEIMRKKYPEEVEALPTNPLPDVLNVRPVKGKAPAQIAAHVSVDPREGVDKVDYAQGADCSG